MLGCKDLLPMLWRRARAACHSFVSGFGTPVIGVGFGGFRGALAGPNRFAL